ncbi:PREDICTED: uncharacterized protein LOC106789947 [Polistes canadensis]|uniref:uncharacterized protein LOC106789947 n=1 Tax=Polistes canadensis TaxID=91411 RepID=UPI000718E652|nr:PREDICTED: uncharacterized protein LOC106789947 [Polistes canadensis]
MGEGRRERSSKRQRSNYGVNKSSSDSELAQDKKNKGRKSKLKERWPFADGLTVDELARYRRRRIEGHSKDNVRSYAESDILENDTLTEYRRAFRAKSEELLKENISPVKSKRPSSFIRLDDTYDNVEPSYNKDFQKYEQLELPSKKAEQHSSFVLDEGDIVPMETQTEQSKFIAHTNMIGRPPIIRRGTSLKREGNFYTETEMYSAYVPYEGQHRAELARRPTSLKMEGEMETMTEKCEKFIQWLNVSRPELMRVPTQLKLEGEFETSTENHEKYVPFVGARRPELLRQGTSLKLEGATTFVAEYTDVFKQHALTDRQPPARKPETHLKTGNNFYDSTENKNNYINPRVREAQLMAELARDVEEEEEEEEKRRKREEEEKEEAKKDKEMQMLVSKLEELKSPPLEIPEYKDAYKDFPRERPTFSKPEDEIGRADGSKILLSPTRLKFSTKIDQDPEYKSKYLDYPKDSFVYRKPPLTLRTTPACSDRFTCNKHNFYETKRYDYEPTSEVKSQYVPYGHVPRVKPMRMPANLRLEGSIDLQPEYRNAYCSQRDYRSSCDLKKQKNRERSFSASRKKDNYWINNNNSERFGCVNAAEDQDAFQVLKTRVHEDSIIGKPPPSNRRHYRGSQSQEPMQSDAVVDHNIIRNRSPSPTYRLHVCNVDDEPRGFGQRKRSTQIESSERMHDPLPDRFNRNIVRKSYSPSFGKNEAKEKQLDNEQSFVVLDNVNKCRNKKETCRRRLDKNYNIENNLSMSRGRPRTPTNWMPPWYDSTNTI